jgi:hypothetical protein
MGSNTFGYPIYRMPDYKKREVAMCAIGHFQHAIFVLAEQDNNDWELYFMVGKVSESILQRIKRLRDNALTIVTVVTVFRRRTKKLRRLTVTRDFHRVM